MARELESPGFSLQGQRNGDDPGLRLPYRRDPPILFDQALISGPTLDRPSCAARRLQPFYGKPAFHAK